MAQTVDLIKNSSFETKMDLLIAAVSGADTGVPSGAILMWSGSPSDIPSGYVICNGSNGTPNLSNKFIVGYGTKSVGDTGSVGAVEAGPQVSYYVLCYIMKS